MRWRGSQLLAVKGCLKLHRLPSIDRCWVQWYHGLLDRFTIEKDCQNHGDTLLKHTSASADHLCRKRMHSLYNCRQMWVGNVQVNSLWKHILLDQSKQSINSQTTINWSWIRILNFSVLAVTQNKNQKGDSCNQLIIFCNVVALKSAILRNTQRFKQRAQWMVLRSWQFTRHSVNCTTWNVLLMSWRQGSNANQSCFKSSSTFNIREHSIENSTLRM